MFQSSGMSNQQQRRRFLDQSADTSSFPRVGRALCGATFCRLLQIPPPSTFGIELPGRALTAPLAKDATREIAAPAGPPMFQDWLAFSCLPPAGGADVTDGASCTGTANFDSS